MIQCSCTILCTTVAHIPFWGRVWQYNTLSWQYLLWPSRSYFSLEWSEGHQTPGLPNDQSVSSYNCPLYNKPNNSGQSYPIVSPSFFTPWTSFMLLPIVSPISSISTFLWPILCPGDYHLKTDLDSAKKKQKKKMQAQESGLNVSHLTSFLLGEVIPAISLLPHNCGTCPGPYPHVSSFY